MYMVVCVEKGPSKCIMVGLLEGFAERIATRSTSVGLR